MDAPGPPEAFVFSYNRGPHLAAALDGLRRLMPDVPVTIADDGSDDALTREVVGRAGLPVLPPARTEGRHGGLYANMQAALEGAAADWVLVTQDDLQVFRPVGGADFALWAAAFEADPDLAVLSPHIAIGGRKARRRTRLERVHEAGFAYRRDAPPNPVLSHYGDIAILHRMRLLERGFRFAATDMATAERVRDLGFSRMLYLAAPFIVPMLYVPTFRGRRTTLGMRLTARAYGEGPHLFEEMDAEEGDAFRDAVRDRPPRAEDWLRPSDPRIRPPYEHKAVNRNPLFRALNKLELKARGSR
ncbi:MAG: glycosyltransferase family 2 protein [Hasllibacter sp.]